MTAEPPLQVESREELVYLLGEACELEHGLMCEYLYAQFSLKRATGEGLTSEQLDRVQAWEATLVDIIKQEMLHLALATNILTAIGAAPHFERPNLPILSRWYPPEVQIAFLPFGERALRHFMYLERPEGMTLADAEGFAAQPGIQPLASSTGRSSRCPSSGGRWATCTGGSRPGSPGCAAATARTPCSSGRRPRRPSPRPSSGRS